MYGLMARLPLAAHRPGKVGGRMGDGLQSAAARLPLEFVLDLALRDRLVAVVGPRAECEKDHPRHEGIDDPDVPRIMYAGALTEAVGGPSARVVVLSDCPDGRDQRHDHGRSKDVDIESASAFDLFDRPLSGKLVAVTRRIQLRRRSCTGWLCGSERTVHGYVLSGTRLHSDHVPFRSHVLSGGQPIYRRDLYEMAAAW